MSPKAQDTYDQYKTKKSLKARFLPRDRKTLFGAFSFTFSWDKNKKFLSLTPFLHWKCIFSGF